MNTSTKSATVLRARALKASTFVEVLKEEGHKPYMIRAAHRAAAVAHALAAETAAFAWVREEHVAASATHNAAAQS